MKTNMFDVTVKVKAVPGDNSDAIFEELIDLLNALHILPYDYDMTLERVGVIL